MKQNINIFVQGLYFILECCRLQQDKYRVINVKNYIWTLKIYKYIYMSKNIYIKNSPELNTYLPLKYWKSKIKFKIEFIMRCCLIGDISLKLKFIELSIV